jgi:hypothetical protein
MRPPKKRAGFQEIFHKAGFQTPAKHNFPVKQSKTNNAYAGQAK